jgi:hypothetical protein
MAGRWIQTAIKRPGALTRKARAAGMSVSAFARKVLAGGRKKYGRTWYQAHFYYNILRKLPKPSRAARVRGARKAARTRARRRR